jgi:periplasmic divalent cation tolerance protein
MEGQSDFCLVYVTTSGVEEAEHLARLVLERRLAACANIYAPIRSLFWWESKIDTATEAVLILKAPAPYYEQIEKLIRSQHSYQTPAILQIPLSQGLPEFFQWIATETQFDY